MGLDITVYQNIKKVDITAEEFDNDLDGSVYEKYDFKAFVISDDWLDRIKNLENNAYYSGDACDIDFSIGYMNYSFFRNQLADMTGKGKNWKTAQCRSDIPFFELLDFADNEGCFDWSVSAELYKDFQEWHDAAKLIGEHDAQFLNRYEKMMKVVEFGKDNGVVKFH